MNVEQGKGKIYITQKQYDKALIVTYILGVGTGILAAIICVKTIQIWGIIK